MELEAWQWAVAGTAAFLSGVSKTGVAGLSVLAIAMFTSVLPARASVGIVLILLIAADIVAVSVYRSNADWRHLLRLMPWTLLGLFFGWLTVGRVDDGKLQILIGGVLVVLVLVHVARNSRVAEEAVTTPRRWFAVLTGVAAGFTTMIANAAGPIMVLYLLAVRLPKLTFIGTSAWFFLVINLIKVPLSFSLGMITPGSLGMSLRLWPFAIAGALSGRILIKHINQKAFETAALILTLLAGLRLLLG